MSDTQNKNNNRDFQKPPFYKDTWFWIAVFFIAVCIIGSLTGDKYSPKAVSSESSRYFTSRASVTESSSTYITNEAESTDKSAQEVQSTGEKITTAKDEETSKKNSETETSSKATETSSVPLSVEETESTTKEVKVSESEKETSTLPSWDGNTVYITPTGKRYHIKESCAGKNATKKSLDDIDEKYTPCQKCAKECE